MRRGPGQQIGWRFVSPKGQTLDLTNVWNLAFVWPIENALLSLTALTMSAGLAIILFTIGVRTLLLPLGLYQARSMKAMARLQPDIAELQRKYANDKQRLGQETMRLYKENGANPVLGCVPLLLQMPIWIALYSALINLSSSDRAKAAANCVLTTVESSTTAIWWAPAAERECDLSFALSTLMEQLGPERWIAEFHAAFLWIPNLGAIPELKLEDPVTWLGLILPVLTAATQWVVQRMSTMPTADPTQLQMQRTMEFMPLMFLFFSFQVASGLVLYWVISNVYSIAQQRFTTGWGTLPWLGSTAAPAAAPQSSSTGAKAPAPRQRRRSAAGGSARRKRGK